MKTKLLKQLKIGVIVITLLGVAGCTKTETQQSNPKLAKFEFLIDWQAEPTYIGIYYAKHLGLFKELGLDVEIIQSWGANQAVASVASGRYKIATASGGATVLGYNSDAKIVSLAVLYPKIPSVVYGLAPTGVTNLAGLRGKKIGIYPSSITANEFQAFVAANHLNTNEFSVVSISGSDIPLLKSGQVDAVLNYWEMSPAAIEVDPNFTEVGGRRTFDISLAKNGVAGYGLNIITSRAELVKEGDLLKKIAAAAVEGYRRACQNPDDAIAAFLKEFPDKNSAYLHEGLNRVCSMIGTNYGTQGSEGWQETINVYRDLGLVKKDVKPEDLLP